jgi:transcriptional regulator with XRE-family HTH domain
MARLSPGKKKDDPRQPNYVDIVVGRNIYIWRVVRGISQTVLGNKIGVTFQQVQKYEDGANRISLGRLTRTARALRVTNDTLLRGADDKRTLARLMLFDRSGAYRLASAFNAIPEGKCRRGIVEMVEKLSAAAMPQPRPRKRSRKKRNG